jgi:hypothetical protein
MATKDSDQLTHSADSSETPAKEGKKKLDPVQLRSAHDFSLTTQALEFRAEDLKKLAQKTKDAHDAPPRLEPTSPSRISSAAPADSSIGAAPPKACASAWR